MPQKEGEYLPSNNDNTVQVTNITDNEYTIDEAVETLGFGKAQMILSIITGIIWMCDAMELTILSIISPEVRCMWSLKAWQEALITTVVFLGMAVSSSWWGQICDKYGRRTGLLLGAAWTTFYGFLSALSPSYFWLLLLRGLTGFGIGSAPQSITLYSEFLPIKSRSRCIMAVEVFWAIGTVLEVFLALIIMPTLGFRWLLALSALPLVVVLMCFGYLPESARYYITHGRIDMAEITLENIAQMNKRRLPAGGLVKTKQKLQVGEINHAMTDISGTSESIAASVRENIPSVVTDIGNGSIKDLFADPVIKKTTILLWIIWFQCAFAYYGLVLLSTSLFKEADEKLLTDYCPAEFKETCDLSCKTLTHKDYADLLWVTVSEFPGLFVAMLLMELVGRKQTMAFSFFGFAISSFMIVFTINNRNWLTFFLFTARALVSGGFQANYVYTPEVYPTKIRALALGSCSGFARIGALITPFVSQVLVENNRTLAIVFYSFLAAMAGIAALMLPIETKGRKMTDNDIVGH